MQVKWQKSAKTGDNICFFLSDDNIGLLRNPYETHLLDSFEQIEEKVIVGVVVLVDMVY